MRAFSRGITLEEMVQLQGKNLHFFQFWGHNVPLSYLNFVGVRS